jgi:uncharacterized damage-inducible protein DinB
MIIGMIDEMLSRWTFTRGMTADFVEQASDECLDLRLGSGFMTIREQAGHLAEVQGVYQLAFTGEAVDFARKGEFAPRSLERTALLEELAARDRELAHSLDGLGTDPSTFRLDWFGTELGVAGYLAVFIQHESLHHGQWAAYAAIADHPRPVSWLLNWGL